jgi:hypothetical protein
MFMKSRRFVKYLAVVVAIGWSDGVYAGQPDPAAELAALQAKYPQQAVVVDNQNVDVTIAMVNGKPVITNNEFNSYFILGDNTTYMADSKEYFSSQMEVKKLEAYSLVPEGGKYKKLMVSKFTKTSEMGDGVFFDDQIAYSYTFPSVVKGTKLISNFSSVNKDCYLPVLFYFGRGVPVDNSCITITCPNEVELRCRLFGYDTTQVQARVETKGNQKVYTWQASMPRSYQGDGLAPSFRYYTPHLMVNIASYNNGSEVVPVLGTTADIYRHNFSKAENVNRVIAPEIKLLADSITHNLTVEREKVRAIYLWVQRNIKYVAIEDGDNGIVPREANLVVQRRYGDCKDKSSVLVSLMRAVGIKASLVWVGTRDLPYRYTLSPSVMVDNHMIACWWDEKDKPHLLDGTTLYHGLDDIPAFIQGKECLIEKGKDDFLVYNIPIASPEANLAVDSLFLTVRNDSLVGQATATFMGEEKANMMRSFAGHDPKRFDETVARCIPKATNKFIVTQALVSDCNNNDAPFKIMYDFVLPGYISSSNGTRYINLNLDRPFQSLVVNADRWLPVECEFNMLKRMVCQLTIPDGYQVTQLPDASNYDHPQFSFSQVYSQQGNKVTLVMDVRMDFQVIEGEQLAQLREMLAKLNRTCLKSIVLTKK